MKKLVLFAAIICFTGVTFAQSENISSAMKANIAQLDSMMEKEMVLNWPTILNGLVMPKKHMASLLLCSILYSYAGL